MIDANTLGVVFGDNPTIGGAFLRGCVDNQRRRLVLGGKLATELNRMEEFLRWLSGALNSGEAYAPCEACVDEQTRLMQRNGSCTSNDTHVIALAQISRCRILCTRDNDLIADFKSKQLINNPRGRIYSIDNNLTQSAANSTLNQWTRRCRGDACHNKLSPPCSHRP